jgi:ribonuclease HI
MFHMLKGIMKGGPSEYILLQFDGASTPNPGRASAGAVLLDKEDRGIIGEAGEYIDHATNNQAEYRGLRLGLTKAKEYGMKELLIEGDSNLIIQQVAGLWKVNHPALKEEHDAVKRLVDEFDVIGIRHVPREQNQKADEITKQVLQTQMGYENRNMSFNQVQPLQEQPSVKEQIQQLSNEIHEVKADVKEILRRLKTLI